MNSDWAVSSTLDRVSFPLEAFRPRPNQSSLYSPPGQVDHTEQSPLRGLKYRRSSGSGTSRYQCFGRLQAPGSPMVWMCDSRN
eukprot:scaffold2893_cov254-Pinguiococcus_pyrenoidosus.AAC.30